MAILITAPELPIAFAENPKAGCSAVKIALWHAIDAARGGPTTYRGNPHTRDGPWYACDQSPTGKETFGVVRDPFARLYSAFHSKLRGRTETTLERWRQMGADRCGGFADFVRLLPSIPANALDRHWRPQKDNIPAGTNRLFRLEAADELEAYLLERIGQPLGVFRVSHYVVPLVDAYTEECEAITRHVYAADFERFGYSERIKRP